MKKWTKLFHSPSKTDSIEIPEKTKALISDTNSEKVDKMAKLLSCNKRAKSSKSPQTEHDILKSMGYTLGKTIGEGTYSKVCVAAVHGRMEDLHKRVACKIIQKKLAGSEFIEKFLPRELGIIRHLQHKHIVAVHNVVEAQDSIYIIMDYCRGGDLLEYVRQKGPLDEELSKHYFRQIVNAVSYLHDLDIAHRDLKCENVLIASINHVKLGDFGFARFCVNENGSTIFSETYCGSAAYAAPEIIQGIPYDPKMYDMWALGCILYIMISATMPFDDTNVKKMLKNQLNHSLCVSMYMPWKSHCVHLQNLIAYLLEPDVARRATIRQVSNCVWLHLKNVAIDTSSSEESLPSTSNHYNCYSKLEKMLRYDDNDLDYGEMSPSSVF